jgi:hypothetical protein
MHIKLPINVTLAVVANLKHAPHGRDMSIEVFMPPFYTGEAKMTRHGWSLKFKQKIRRIVWPVFAKGNLAAFWRN